MWFVTVYDASDSDLPVERDTLCINIYSTSVTGVKMLSATSLPSVVCLRKRTSSWPAYQGNTLHVLEGFDSLELREFAYYNSKS
jgi:hypothetical protein